MHSMNAVPHQDFPPRNAVQTENAIERQRMGPLKKVYVVEFFYNLCSSIFLPVAPLMKGSWQNVMDVFCPIFTREGSGDRSHKWQTI